MVASVLLDRAVGLVAHRGARRLWASVSGGLRAGPLVVVAGGDSRRLRASALVVLRRAPPALVERLVDGARRAASSGRCSAYVRDPRAPRAIAAAAALSVVVAAVQFVVIRGLVFALGAVPDGEKWVYVGTAMAFIVGALPALPGGWGTADAAYVFFFGLGGIAGGAALAVCLLYRLFWYLFGVVGALLRLSRRESVIAPVQGPDDDARSQIVGPVPSDPGATGSPSP